jgi:branched-chain amino acid aminotransferase
VFPWIFFVLTFDEKFPHSTSHKLQALPSYIIASPIMNKLVYLEDRFLSEETAKISILDLGVQRGYSVFDFFRLVGNHPLHLDDHLDRFYYSAGQLRLPIPKSRDEIKQIIHELIWENDLPGSGIRVQLCGGNFSDSSENFAPLIFISQGRFPAPSAVHFENGIHLASYEYQRQLPQVKTTDYLMSIWLQPFLKEQSADELLYHVGGMISESPRSNFFIVTQENKLVTPAAGILKGVTRMKVLELASALYTIEERGLSIEEAIGAKEAFITSTTKQILPVTQIDHRRIGNGSRGPVSTELARRLNEMLKRTG